MHVVVFFQAEDGIRYLVRSRGLGDVYKRQPRTRGGASPSDRREHTVAIDRVARGAADSRCASACLLYTSDAADERSSVDLGGRRIIKKKTMINMDAGICKTDNKRYRTTLAQDAQD